ncbi:MAG: Mbeg1-like protein [Lachnospiraceae bacterium]|nr:Mbeg1-like protein [Lachnospiraceae bacterium]
MAYTDVQLRAFTEIAYMDLTERYLQCCKKNDTDCVSLTDVLDKDEIDKLNKYGIAIEELEKWEMVGVHDTNDENGFYACMIKTPDDSVAICYRGSEPMNSYSNVKNDWVNADIELVNSTCTNQHKEVHEFYTMYKDKLDKYESITMVGHSLGGNLAEYATIVSEEYGLDDNIKQCVSMDGPGFSDEFIDKYRDQINKMSDVMYHPRWSFVGTMLQDLPGVEYKFVAVSNKANRIDNEEYSSISRHSTKYLKYDGENLVDGEQDLLSKHTEKISEGVDHMPDILGDAMITILGNTWINIMYTKENFIKDGKISEVGWKTIAGSIGLITLVGPVVVVKAVVIVAVAIVGIALIAGAVEWVYDSVVEIKEQVCKLAKEVYELGVELVEAVVDIVDTVVDGLVSLVTGKKKKKKDYGAEYAKDNPYIELNTYKMRDYADRLANLIDRVKELDDRIDTWMRKMGPLFWCSFYNLPIEKLAYSSVWLTTTADEFDDIENELVGLLE